LREEKDTGYYTQGHHPYTHTPKLMHPKKVWVKMKATQIARVWTSKEL
jgi:hypothetical protein